MSEIKAAERSLYLWQGYNTNPVKGGVNAPKGQKQPAQGNALGR